LETPNAEDRKLKTERNRDTTLRKLSLRPAGGARKPSKPVRDSLLDARVFPKISPFIMPNPQHVKVGIWSFRISCRIPFNGPVLTAYPFRLSRAVKKDPAEGDICTYAGTRKLVASCANHLRGPAPLRVQMSLAHSMKLPSQR
jgi:hypothetical protein